MAAELKESLGIDAELIAGGGGVFDVRVNGVLCFSKLGDDDRFPKPGEITKILRKV